MGTPINKVLTSTEQELSKESKEMARNNIDAANVNVETSTGIIYISNAERASDDNDGLTPNTPVRTLEAAVQRFNKYYSNSEWVKFSVIDSSDMTEIDISNIYAVDSDGYSRYINAIEITSDDSMIGIKGSNGCNLFIKTANYVKFTGDTYAYGCTVESEYIEFNPGFNYRFENDCILNAKTVQMSGDNQSGNQGKIVFNKLLIKAMLVQLSDTWNENNRIDLEVKEYGSDIIIEAYSVSLNSIKSKYLSIKSHYLNIENISMGGNVSLIGDPTISNYSSGPSNVYVRNITGGSNSVLIKDFDTVNIADQPGSLIDVYGMEIDNAKYVYSSSDATGIRVNSDFFIKCTGSVILDAKDVAVNGLLAITADYIGFDSSDGIVSAEEYSFNAYEPNDESAPYVSLYNLRGKRSNVSDPSSDYADCIERLKIKFGNVYINRHIEVRTAEIECQYLSEYNAPYFGDLTIVSDRVYVGTNLQASHIKLKTNKLEMGSMGPITIGRHLPPYLVTSNWDPNTIDVGVLTGAGQRGAFQFAYGDDEVIDANINVDLMVLSNWNNNGTTDQLLCTKGGNSTPRGQITGRVGGLLVGSDGKLSPWPNDYNYNCNSYTSEYCTISIDWCTPDKLNFYIDLGAGNDSFTGLSPNSPVASVNGLKKAMESVGGGSAFQCIHVAGSSLGGSLNFSDEYFSSKFSYLELVSCNPFMSLTIVNLNCSVLKANNFNDIKLYNSNVSMMALIDAQYIDVSGDSSESTKYRFNWLYSKSHYLRVENLSLGSIYSDCDTGYLNCTCSGTVSVYSKNNIDIYGGSYSGSVNFISDYQVAFRGDNSLYGYTIVDSPNISGKIANQAFSGTIELKGNRILPDSGSLNMGTSGSGRLWVRDCKDFYLPDEGINFFNFEVDIDAQYIRGGNLSHYGNNPGCLCRINANEIDSSCQIKLMNDTAYITANKLEIPVSIMTAGPSYGSTKLVLEARDCMQGAVYYDNYTTQVGYPVDVELLIHDLYGDLFGSRTSPIIYGDADTKVVNIKATILRDHTDGTWLDIFNDSSMSGLVSDIQILNKSKKLVAGTGIEILDQEDSLLIYASTPIKSSIVSEEASELELEHGVITDIGVDARVSTLTLTYSSNSFVNKAFNCGFSLSINPENTTFTQLQIHTEINGSTYNVPINGLPSAFVSGKRYMGTLVNGFATLAEYEPLTLIEQQQT